MQCMLTQHVSMQGQDGEALLAAAVWGRIPGGGRLCTWHDMCPFKALVWCPHGLRLLACLSRWSPAPVLQRTMYSQVIRIEIGTLLNAMRATNMQLSADVLRKVRGEGGSTL